MADTATPMTFKKISIKSFMCDLPNVINGNFEKIVDFINSVYDFAKKKLHNLTDIEVSGSVTANTVKSKNFITSNMTVSNEMLLNNPTIKVKDVDGTIVSVNLIDLVRQMQETINN